MLLFFHIQYRRHSFCNHEINNSHTFGHLCSYTLCVSEFTFCPLASFARVVLLRWLPGPAVLKNWKTVYNLVLKLISTTFNDNILFRYCSHRHCTALISKHVSCSSCIYLCPSVTSNCNHPEQLDDRASQAITITSNRQRSSLPQAREALKPQVSQGHLLFSPAHSVDCCDSTAAMGASISVQTLILGDFRFNPKCVIRCATHKLWPDQLQDPQ